MIFSQVRQHIYTLLGLFLGLFFGPVLLPVFEQTCSPGDFVVHDSPEYAKNMKADEYLPQLNLAEKPLKAKKPPQKFLRPRFFSTELGIRKKLFVAVLTTQKTINTRGISVNQTTSHLVDKLTFFIDTLGTEKLNVSYLKLPGIVGFFDTRVILKPFHVLKYIKDNFIEDYDFFFIINDNAYIKARKLNEMVAKISTSQDVYAGTKVKNNKICSLDAGILFSNSVIQNMVKNIDWCVKNVYSSSDDDNFGRCALKSSNIVCQEIVQGHKFSTFPLQNDEQLDINTLESEELKDSLTVFPIKNIHTYYLLHAYFASIELQKAGEKIKFLRQSIIQMTPFAPGGTKSITWPVGNQPTSKPSTRFDVIRWDYFTDTHIYLTNEFHNLRRLNSAEKEDIKVITETAVDFITKKYYGQYYYGSLTNGYRKFDASRGMEYILDLKFRDISTNSTILKRIEICKPLGEVEMLTVPYVTENRRVNILLPIRIGDRDTAIQFLQQYKTECLAKREKIFLMMIFIYDYNAPGKGTKDDVFKDLKNKALSLTKMYQKDDNRVAWLSIKLPFSTNQAMEEALLNFAVVDLSLKKFMPDALILLASPYMKIRIEYLNRVRMNTILGWQVFSPVPFSEYSPLVHNLKDEKIDVNKKYGRFDLFSSGLISFYAKDYFTTRKRTEAIIPLIKSDSDLRLFRESEGDQGNLTSLALHNIYGMFVQYGDMQVIRGVEPGLILKYKELDCNSFANKATRIVATLYEHCIEKRNWNLGSRSQLAKLLIEYQESNKINLSI